MILWSHYFEGNPAKIIFKTFVLGVKKYLKIEKKILLANFYCWGPSIKRLIFLKFKVRFLQFRIVEKRMVSRCLSTNLEGKILRFWIFRYNCHKPFMLGFY